MRLNYRLPKHLTMAAATAVTIVLLLHSSAGATIINVPADQASIQAAIDYSTSGDTVLVAPGTYYENINFHGKRVVVTSDFMFDRDPAYIFSTIIDGSQPTSPDTGSCVRFHTYEDSTTILQGFTLTGGTGTVWLDEHGFGTYREGGGILCQGSAPTIQYNYITNNEAIATGGGLTSSGGGGIRAGDGNPHILNNLITYNKGRYGAGIVLNYCGAVIRNNVIAYNSGGQDYGGSGIWKYGSAPTAVIENNTIVYNISSRTGGGVYNWSATMTLINNIIRGNVGSPVAQVANSGSLTASYCNVEGGLAGSNMTDVEPEFYGAFLYLPDGSPSVDGGTPGSLYDEQPDPASPASARWPSRGSLTCDLGAYGGPGAYPFELLTFGADTTVGWTPLDVRFTAACRSAVSTWSWNFGDGQTDEVANPLHTYDLGGTFDVALTADTGGGLLSATRPAYIVALADSLIPPDTVVPKNAAVMIPIRARNVIPLSQLIVPLRVYGNVGLTFDSFSTAGCRTDYFELQQLIDSDSFNRRYTIKLVSSAVGTSPDLAPGHGDILRLYFTVPWNVPVENQDTIALDGYASYTPLFVGDVATYAPRIRPGFVGAACCMTRGNADGDPAGTINVADLTYMVAWLFRSGPRPPCDDEANVDGSAYAGSPNVADLTYLIKYLMQGGAPPPACP